MKSGFLGLALALVASAALAGAPATIVNQNNSQAAQVETTTPGASDPALVVRCIGCASSGTATVQGSQSNAGAGTTGNTNVPTNSYMYCFNSGWVQFTGAACPITIGGPIGRSADAASLSAALSNEDMAVFAGVTPSTASPCASATTASCNLAAELQLLIQTAAAAINCEALSAEQTKATTGNPIVTACDLVGKLVTSPYANRENMARGFATETGTSAGTILAASGSASLKEYVTGIQCYNTSATTDTVTINDGASTKIINPAGSGNNQTYSVPLVAAANTAVTFTATTGETTEGCAAQGFYGY